MIGKEHALIELAKKRQMSKREGYRNISDFHGGVYECDYVSPYTKSAHNSNARVMVMLQDWLGADKLSGPIIADIIRFGQLPSLPTNKRLKQLLDRHLCIRLSDTYATNLFPLIKNGNLSENIPVKDMVWAAQEFAIPQIQIVQPLAVVCLGLKTFNSLRRAAGEVICSNLKEAIGVPFKIGVIEVYCQAHTGTLGQNARGRSQVEQDWARMAEAINLERLNNEA